MLYSKWFGRLLPAVFLFLAACSSRQPIQPQILPAPGAAVPAGYVYEPGHAGVRYRAVTFSDLPQWHRQSFAQSLKAFRLSCVKLAVKPGWNSACRQAGNVKNDDASAGRFFETYFTPWEVSQNGILSGTVTGYYEPVLTGDLKQTAKARYPIYGIPDDFVTVPLPQNLRQVKTVVRVRRTAADQGIIVNDGPYTAALGDFPVDGKTQVLKGRFAGERFVPYYTRAEINAGALNGHAPILGYADDPVELFFLQIQGSGRLQTPDGRHYRLGYADKNNFPYVSVARYMAEKGYLPLAAASMQGIKAWMRSHPEKLAEVLGQNPSFVFFRRMPEEGGGPVGALGVPLTDGFAGAVDRHFISLGAPLYLATTHPLSGHGLNRLIMAQDTGSAINGAVRVDFFWGFGDEAGAIAGKMKHPGYVWQLLPKGVLPEAGG